MKRKFAITLESVPILNTGNFSDIFGGHSLPFDDQQLIRALEMIALEGTVLEIIEENDLIYQVKLDTYPVETPLYIDRRFVKEIAELACTSYKLRSGVRQAIILDESKLFEGKVLCSDEMIDGAVHPDVCEKCRLETIDKKVPSIGEIQGALIKKIGSAYIWGGNDCSGIKKMLEFYPPKKPLNALEKRSWIFKGCDCSGLLFEVTMGITPRNVCWLMHYGQACNSHKRCSEMEHIIKPLDLFVWPGHVVIVLNDMETIESKCEWGGVVKMPLKERLEKILLDRKCLYTDPSSCTAEKGFVIRRWHPENM